MDKLNLKELLKKANSRKGNLIEDRIRELDARQQNILFHFVVFNEYLSPDDILSFLEICDLGISNDDLLDLIRRGVTEDIIEPRISDGEPIPYFKVADNVQKYIWNKLSDGEKHDKHVFAEKFYQEIFLTAIKAIYYSDESTEQQLDDESLIIQIIRPTGFIDFGAHYPQAPGFHDWSISRAYYWQEHLFAIEKYGDAADITNSICFALARKGHKKIAQGLLLRNAAATDGLHKSVALVNLATLLREDQEHKSALQIYRRALVPLFSQRAGHQIAGVFSEISNIHRDIGHIFRALVYQHLSSLMRSMIKDLKGKAICNNQLSILYRTLRLRKAALRYSKAAEKHWRFSDDKVNLAKTLLTQGNIYYQMGQSTNALQCFEESAEINFRIESFGEAASCLSGKARANIQLQNYDKAKEYLEEAISLRERFSDRRIGIEYENMGALHEAQGDFALALGWYKKALPYFERHQPAFAANCQRKTGALNKRIRS